MTEWLDAPDREGWWWCRMPGIIGPGYLCYPKLIVRTAHGLKIADHTRGIMENSPDYKWCGPIYPPAPPA